MLVFFRELGLSAIPVKGKVAVVKDWSRWCQELPPMETVEKWQKYFQLPEYGVAICAGAASGIDALDIDSNSRDIIDMCPRSPLTRIGARGGMPLFRHNPKLIKRKQDRDNLANDGKPTEGIQLLSTGNYFVVPPSIHPTTKKPYFWANEYTLENFSVNDLEELSQDELDNAAVYIARFCLTGKDGQPMNSAGGRNNKLTVMCCAKIKNNLWKSDEEIAAELVDYDNRTHLPPYFSDPGEQYYRKAASPIGRAIVFVKGSRERMRKKGHL